MNCVIGQIWLGLTRSKVYAVCIDIVLFRQAGLKLRHDKERYPAMRIESSARRRPRRM